MTFTVPNSAITNCTDAQCDSLLYFDDGTTLYSYEESGVDIEVDNNSPCIVVISLTTPGADYRLEDVFCNADVMALCKCSP